MEQSQECGKENSDVGHDKLKKNLEWKAKI